MATIDSNVKPQFEVRDGMVRININHPSDPEMFMAMTPETAINFALRLIATAKNAG